MNWNPTFIGMQVLGATLGCLPTIDALGAGLQGYLAASLIVYGIAARRLGGWWI